MCGQGRRVKGLWGDPRVCIRSTGLSATSQQPGDRAQQWCHGWVLARYFYNPLGCGGGQETTVPEGGS